MIRKGIIKRTRQHATPIEVTLIEHTGEVNDQETYYIEIEPNYYIEWYYNVRPTNQKVYRIHQE